MGYRRYLPPFPPIGKPRVSKEVESITQTSNTISINFDTIDDAVEVIALVMAKLNGTEPPNVWAKLSDAAPILGQSHNCLAKQINRIEKLRQAKKVTEWKYGTEYRR